MKPHPRIRRTAKWGALVAAVLLTMVWVSSAWYFVCYVHTSGVGWSLQEGDLGIVVGPYRPGVSTWNARGRAPHLILWGWHLHTSGGFTSTGLPLWPLVLVLYTGAGLCWRHDRRASEREQVGVCPACGYDRRGLASPDAV